MSNLYYTPPTEEAFEEIKREAIAEWKTFDNQFGYADEKLKRIQYIGNVEDNAMYILAMFDQGHFKNVVGRLSEKTKDQVRDRLRAGGNDAWYIASVGL